MEKRNIKLVLAYDGTRYCGWQRQRDDPTIQGVLEDRIQGLLGEQVRLNASGRTDAGVHARGQVCNFVTSSPMPAETIRRALNAMVPEDIFIRSAEPVPLHFHARYDAVSKTYEYQILNREEPDLFLRWQVWQLRIPLDVKRMAACASLLLGKKDFSSFRSSGSGNRNPFRTVMKAEFENFEEGLLKFVIEADGFLRHMVRSIVGTLVAAGLGRIDPEGFREILDGAERRLAGMKAPARGLFLRSVQY